MKPGAVQAISNNFAILLRPPRPRLLDGPVDLRSVRARRENALPMPVNALIYLDHQATTPLDPAALEAMLPFLTVSFGNPSSVQHRLGAEAHEAVERARGQVADLIGSSPREVVFLSGATEANNLALKGLSEHAGARRRVVSVTTEHHAVLEPLDELSRRGFDVTLVPVDGDGVPDLDQLEGLVDDRTLVVSVAVANNEIGSLPPLADIATIAHAKGALLHTDAAQAIGKVPFDVGAVGVDLLSLSAHKLYGPKGVGALYVREEHRHRLHAIINGGAHERGLRSGTVNVPGVVGLGAAASLAGDVLDTEPRRLISLRDRFLDHLRELLPDIEVNGPPTHRLPGNLNLRFPGVDAEALMTNCPGVAFSTGSACSTGLPRPSHVLLAVGLSSDKAEESARFGFGRTTTIVDVDSAAEQVAVAAQRVRAALAAPPQIAVP